MAGLWSNDQETPEGKYPILLRRDGSVVTTPYFVLFLRDPAAEAALDAYAKKARELGYNAKFVQDIFGLADLCEEVIKLEGPGDRDGQRHRVDDPIVIAWARSAHGLNKEPTP